MTVKGNNTQYACDSCGVDISNLVQIRCAECSEIDLCVPCFAKGYSTDTHKPWHDYYVEEPNSFPIFDREWGADEEELLIEASEQYGLGSWEDVAEHIGNRSREEVAEHYEKVYINSPTYPIPELDKKFGITREQFSRAKAERLETFRRQQMPPLKPKTLVSAPACHDIQGYMPGRLEFDTEAENEAEMSVKDMIFEPDDTELDVELKLAVMEVYNQRLTRRSERKRVIFSHDLTDYKRLVNSEKKRVKEDRDLLNKLKPYVRLLPLKEYDDFTESMAAEQQCRRRIAELQEYRQNGIKTLQVANRYEKDKAYRAQYFNRNTLSAPSKLHHPEDSAANNKMRKGNNPLDISNASDVDLLTPQEKSLCSQLRMLPLSFLAIKEAIFAELVRNGGSMKKKALKEVLGRMEDNKVSRIYDYFQTQNWIY